jgi:hypothetical protein
MQAFGLLTSLRPSSTHELSCAASAHRRRATTLSIHLTDENAFGRISTPAARKQKSG